MLTIITATNATPSTLQQIKLTAARTVASRNLIEAVATNTIGKKWKENKPKIISEMKRRERKKVIPNVNSSKRLNH